MCGMRIVRHGATATIRMRFCITAAKISRPSALCGGSSAHHAQLQVQQLVRAGGCWFSHLEIEGLWAGWLPKSTVTRAFWRPRGLRLEACSDGQLVHAACAALGVGPGGMLMDLLDLAGTCDPLRT